MFSRILIKLVDEAIFPAILLLATRLTSMLLISKFLNISYEINANGIIFVNLSDYLKVNSYSTLFMVITLAIGLLFIILKSLVFHDSHISPGFSAKIYSLKMPSLIQSSFDIYSQGTIWLSYIYLILIVSGFMTLFGMLYSWVFFIAIITTVISTAFFVMDIEHEVKIDKQRDVEYDSDSKYLEREEE
jgi:hypothetical protein